MLRLQTLGIFLLGFLRFCSSSTSPCFLCPDSNSSRCQDKRLISLDDLETRDRISELQISYNDIPKLTDYMFRDLGFSHVKRIHCKNCGIYEIEPKTFEGLHTLKFLHLSNNNIYELQSNTFYPLQKLRILDLNDNKLSFVDGITAISSLQYCYLADNFLVSLNNETFCSLDVCEMIILDLSNNLISAIDTHAFKGLIHLQDLNLSFNNLQYLNYNTFVHMIALHNLNLRENRLHRLDFIHEMPWLSNLDISFNNISLLTNDVLAEHNTSQIRTLKLGNNNISFVEPKAFRNLPNLVDLDLSHNQIEAIPSRTFAETSSLEIVKLRNNYLTDLNFVQSIKKLRFLYAEKNRLTHLDKTTFYPKHIHTVDVSNNFINNIKPSAFVGVNKLLHLDLRGNNISSLSSEVFQRTHVLDLDLNYNGLSSLNFIQHSLNFHILHLPNNNLTVLSPELLPQSKVYTMTEINLSNNGMTAIKPGSFNTMLRLKTVNLSNNRLRGLPLDVFQSVVSLTTLVLSNNDLVDISFISHCRNLKYVHLQGNKIAALINSSFLNPESPQESKIELLNLENNEISIIEAGAFQGMPELKKLILCKNRITAFHLHTLQYTFSLRALDLSQNLLPHLDFIPYISSLRRLYIMENAISVLPRNAFTNSNYSQLYEINLSNNEITTIDDMAFQGLRDLTILNLSGNNITYLYPKSFEHSVFLSSIDLSRNKISEIYIFDYTPNLKSCNLANNIIHVLPNQMFPSTNSSNLCKLNLANNRISTIEYHAFSGLTRLKDLDLSGNNITSIHPQIFSFVNSVLRLDISNNKINHPDFFQYMPLLRQLNLRNNDIRILKNYTFTSSQISQLIFINLARNQIFQIESMAFHGLPMLKFLDLSENYLYTLPVNLFENNSILSALDLNNNYLSRLEFLPYLTNLQYLNLSSNQILMLGNNSFSNSAINRLKYIDVSNNTISLIEHRAFHDLPKLEHLDLSGNNMSYFYTDILEHSPKLKSMDLRFYPTTWKGKEVIDMLQLANNLLKDIRVHFKMWWNLPENT